MRLSKKFVNDYTNIQDIDFLEYANKMLKLGNEYESISNLVTGTKLVIGKVIECEMHPESDHLHVCKVDIKSEVLNIICGAPNMRKGIKVIVALDGAELPGGTIKKSTILGYESNGMCCSLAELGVDKKFLTEEDINGIHELDDKAPIGEDPVKYLELDDQVIDFELTANRADELSMLGLACESAVITGNEVKLPDLTYKTTKDDIKDHLELKVDTPNVYTFLVKRVNGIKIEESPLFIKNRLMACGIRSINNVVDISNYVMLETGQPLHFYDADKLGKNVVVECAIFDPISIRKTSKKLVRSEASIRYEKGLDVNRCYMAIDRACNMLQNYAGGKVLSGMLEYNTLSREDKEIDISLDKINSVLGYNLTVEDVKNVFEKLNFQVKTYKNIFKVTVPTRRIDISIPEDLIEEVSRVYGVDNIESTLPVFESTPSKHNNRLRIVRNEMVSLGLNEVITYSLINVDDVFKFTNDEFGLIKILSPLTEERSVLRHSLITSLLDVYKYNKARNIKDLSIFEIGRGFSLINGEYIEENKLACLLTGSYTEGLNKEYYDFYVVKGLIENLLDDLGYQNRYSFVVKELPEEMHPTKSVYIEVGNKVVGMFGEVHPSITKDEVYVVEINLDTLFENKTGRIKFKEFSKFPGISKDVAFILSKDTKNEAVISTIKQAGGKLLTKIELFDYYEGDKIDSNKKSVAYNLYFESNEKTLSDEEVNPAFDSIIEAVIKKHNAILRDK